MTPEELAAFLALSAEARAAALAAMSPDELVALATQLTEATNPLLDGDATDEGNAQLQAIGTALAAIGAVQAEQTAATEARETQRRELAEQIAGMVTPTDPEGDPAPAPEGEGGDADPAPAGDPTATDGAPVPVAAGAGTARPLPVATRVAARRPAQVAPPAPVERPFVLTAAGTFDDIQVGQRLDSDDLIARAFLAAFQGSRGYRGARTRVPIVRSSLSEQTWVDQDRWLGLDPVLNERTLNRQLGQPGSLTAAGGICAPQQTTYDIPTVGTDARPVRDTAMARFGADRGGIKTLPIPTIGDLDGAISLWDNATDTNPGEETKACLVIPCEADEDESLVQAIVRCLRTGNFRARYFQEQVAAWLRLAAVNQARRAENILLADIAAGSTHVSVQTTLGTTRDILATLDRAISNYQQRYRDPDTQFRWVAPMWLLANIRTDIARQMPVGTLDETLALADVQINRWFAARPNLHVTWHLDGEAGQIAGAQGDGPLEGWHSHCVSYLYPEGSWLFLDGGQLDFGIVRDSTLNGVNDFQMFAETMEGSHFHGIESLRIDNDICPDGSASALVDINPCATGS